MGTVPENEVEEPTAYANVRSIVRPIVVGRNPRGSVRDTLLAVVVIVALIVAGSAGDPAVALVAMLAGVTGVIFLEAGR